MIEKVRAPGFWGRLAELRESPQVAAFDKWLRSPWYILTLGVLTTISNLLELDLILITVFVALGIFIGLLGSDFLPLMPILLLCYIAPSRENNPGRYPQSVYYPQNGGIYLMIMIAVMTCTLILRLIFDKELGGKGFLTEKRRLMPSMLLLGAAYLLSGVGMDGYRNIMVQNLVFAALQFLAIFVMYFLFTGAVRWDRAPKDYLAWIGMTMGLLVFIQLMENYLSGRIFEDGTLDRELIATGWGMHNNVGCLMAMMMPFAFYLAGERKHGWIFNLLGTVLLGGAFLTCSRTSMFMGVLGYGVCAFLLLKDPKSRRSNLWIYLAALGAVAVAGILLLPKLLKVFELFISQLGNVSQRDNLLYYGICQFISEPVFGGSFFPQGSYVPWDWANLDSFSSFFPPRWHNTLVQLLASCGTVGITAYFIHRYQTVKLFLSNRSRENTFIAISLGILLCAALLDCHFFNIGPVLFYSAALAVVEKSPK